MMMVEITGVEQETKNTCKPDGLTTIDSEGSRTASVIALNAGPLQLSKSGAEEKAGYSQDKIMLIMSLCQFHVVSPLTSMVVLLACC